MCPIINFLVCVYLYKSNKAAKVTAATVVNVENPQPNAKIQNEIRIEDLTDDKVSDAAPLNIENPKLYFESRIDGSSNGSVNGEVKKRGKKVLMVRRRVKSWSKCFKTNVLLGSLIAQGYFKKLAVT